MSNVPSYFERIIEAVIKASPDVIGESSEINHDQTQGGTAGNPHADSAAISDISPIQSSGDVDHDSTIGGTDSDAHHSKTTSSEIGHDQTQGGTAGNPHADSASTSHAATHTSGGDDEVGLNDLDLPNGAKIDEDGGDLVVRDNVGNVVLRYNEGDGSWQLDALKAGGFNFIGEFDTLSKFDTVAEPGDKGYITEAQQFARQP